MKTILAAIGISGLIGCSTQREIQVEMVPAELIKIDTVFRHPNEQKQLTWRDRNNVEYISFVSMDNLYPIGASIIVLRAR